MEVIDQTFSLEAGRNAAAAAVDASRVLPANPDNRVPVINTGFDWYAAEANRRREQAEQAGGV